MENLNAVISVISMVGKGQFEGIPLELLESAEKSFRKIWRLRYFIGRIRNDEIKSHYPVSQINAGQLKPLGSIPSELAHSASVDGNPLTAIFASDRKSRDRKLRHGPIWRLIKSAE